MRLSLIIPKLEMWMCICNVCNKPTERSNNNIILYGDVGGDEIEGLRVRIELSHITILWKTVPILLQANLMKNLEYFNL